ETLADESGNLPLVLECIEATDNATSTVAQQEHRNVPFARFGACDQGGDVVSIVSELLDVEAFSFRLAATAEVKCMYREAICRQLLCGPCVVAAVCVEAVHDGNHRARLRARAPGAREDVQTVNLDDAFLLHRPSRGRRSLVQMDRSRKSRTSWI